jgi:hypothetical protein
MVAFLKSIVVQIIPVIIGILIALFINNWNEERKEKEYLSKILSSIELELEETQKDIEEELITQRSLIDTLIVYLEDESTTLQGIMTKTNGVNMPKIRINSWKALANSRIELIDYETISHLAGVEDDRAILNDKSKYLMNFLYTNIGEKTRYSKAVFIGLMNDVIGTEDWILQEISELRESLKG